MTDNPLFEGEPALCRYCHREIRWNSAAGKWAHTDTLRAVCDTTAEPSANDQEQGR